MTAPEINSYKQEFTWSTYIFSFGCSFAVNRIVQHQHFPQRLEAEAFVRCEFHAFMVPSHRLTDKCCSHSPNHNTAHIKTRQSATSVFAFSHFSRRLFVFRPKIPSSIKSSRLYLFSSYGQLASSVDFTLCINQPLQKLHFFHTVRGLFCCLGNAIAHTLKLAHRSSTIKY